MVENEEKDEGASGPKDRVSGFAQKVFGEIEALAGVVNADPLAQAEGEFNVEVGAVREDLEDNNIDEEKDQ